MNSFRPNSSAVLLGCSSPFRDPEIGILRLYLGGKISLRDLQGSILQSTACYRRNVLASVSPTHRRLVQRARKAVSTVDIVFSPRSTPPQFSVRF